MIFRVDIENCLGIWKFVQGYGCYFLVWKVFKFILYYFFEICYIEDFRVFDVYDVISIISDNDLNVKDEEIVMEIVFDWVYVDFNNRKQYIVIFFLFLRFLLL